MKKYNIQGYIRDKNDLEQVLDRIPDYGVRLSKIQEMN